MFRVPVITIAVILGASGCFDREQNKSSTNTDVVESIDEQDATPSEPKLDTSDNSPYDNRNNPSVVGIWLQNDDENDFTFSGLPSSRWKILVIVSDDMKAVVSQFDPAYNEFLSDLTKDFDLFATQLCFVQPGPEGAFIEAEDRHTCIHFEPKSPGSDDMKYCSDVITDERTGEALCVYLSKVSGDQDFEKLITENITEP